MCRGSLVLSEQVVLSIHTYIYISNRLDAPHHNSLPHVICDDKFCTTAGSIVGIALAIICVLFLIQRFGTRVVGSAFSPVILLWLLFNAMIGIYNMHTYGAGVFRAFGPNYWFAYLQRNGHSGWKSLGGVVLCITGTALQ